MALVGFQFPCHLLDLLWVISLWEKYMAVSITDAILYRYSRSCAIRSLTQDWTVQRVTSLLLRALQLLETV